MVLNLDLNLISIFLTDFAVLIAFIQFRKIEIDRRKQVIKTIFNQLEVTGAWAQVNSQGYLGNPSDQEKIEWANPFKYVYRIKHEGLQSIALQEGVIDFPDRFISRLFEYNQNISRIKDLTDFKKNVTASNFEIAIKLENQVKTYLSVTNPISTNWNSFLTTLNTSVMKKNLSRVSRMAELFVEYGSKIHYEIIGSDNSNGMKQQHNELEKFISQIERKLCQPSIFNIASFSLLLLILFFILFTFFNYQKFFTVYYGVILLFDILIAVSIELFYIRNFKVKCPVNER